MRSHFDSEMEMRSRTLAYAPAKKKTEEKVDKKGGESKEMASHCTALNSVAKLKLRTAFFELVTHSGAGKITKELSLKPAFMEAFNSAAINNQELAMIVLIHGHIELIQDHEVDLREQATHDR